MKYTQTTLVGLALLAMTLTPAASADPQLPCEQPGESPVEQTVDVALGAACAGQEITGDAAIVATNAATSGAAFAVATGEGAAGLGGSTAGAAAAFAVSTATAAEAEATAAANEATAFAVDSCVALAGSFCVVP